MMVMKSRSMRWAKHVAWERSSYRILMRKHRTFLLKVVEFSTGLHGIIFRKIEVGIAIGYGLGG
jgi:hypothetical protein